MDNHNGEQSDDMRFALTLHIPDVGETELPGNIPSCTELCVAPRKNAIHKSLQIIYICLEL